MKIGILKEIKKEEYRVSMTPFGVSEMNQNGHEVIVEKNAGAGSGLYDDAYRDAGAIIADTPDEIFEKCEMIMHVKEPQPSEFDLVRKGQIIFTYFHFAADERLTNAFVKTESINIAYETIETKGGSLPLLTPMSEVAGRMAAQQAAKYLERPQGGRGILMGGATGVAPAEVLVVGGGVVGTNAATKCCGLGAKVHILDTNLERLRYLTEIMPSNCFPMMSSQNLIKELVKTADAVIGAVLVPGGKAPMLVTKKMLNTMKKGAVMVDVAIDQGGCFETSRPTTHLAPVYEIESILHYCVANMPGAVPVTSTMALTNATLPYALQIADKGWKKAACENEEIKKGLNIIAGIVVHKGVAEAFGLEYTSPEDLLK